MGDCLMAKLILTRGIPASGKTTWAKSWVGFELNRARCNRDDLRAMLFDKVGKLTNDEETRVTQVQQATVKTLLKKGYDVVIDDTNLVNKFIKEWFKLAENMGVEVEVIDFPIARQDAVNRDAKRGVVVGGRSVGASVIDDYFNRFVNKDGTLRPVPEFKSAKFPQYVPNTELDPAILVDIDGTLAHMNGRGPYDDSLVHTDTPDEVIREIVNEHYKNGMRVIIFSARDEKSRPQTAKWLRDNGIKFDELHMRTRGDKRNDAVVKNEMFHAYVADRFNVKFVLDDRDRVVDMWRSKGITCLQVAYGDF